MRPFVVSTAAACSVVRVLGPGVRRVVHAAVQAVGRRRLDTVSRSTRFRGTAANLFPLADVSAYLQGGSVAEWLACWTQEQ